MSDAFPLRDPVGPADPAAVVPRIDVIVETVAAGAAAADSGGVRRSTLDALASAGLLGSPLDSVAAQRELGELIAGSDASTWFCWAQHQTPLRILEAKPPAPDDAGPLRERLLPGLRAGSLLAAVAFAHVRRPGPANPVATRTADGWRLDGTLDWVTSWDIADVVMVMAQGADADAGRLVCCYLPAGRAMDRTPGVEPGEPLALLSMSGTHTRPLRLAGVSVGHEQVGALLDREQWLADDAVASANASPAAFGVARGAIAELDALAQRRSDPLVAALADALGRECAVVRRRAYAAADDPGAPATERLARRAESLDLAARAASAVVVARAGAGMLTGQPAERRLRESMFLQVQAQTGLSRQAALTLALSRSASAGS